MQRLAVVRTDKIGDLMLALPVAEALKAGTPGSWLAFVVSPETAELARACPYVDEVIEYAERGKQAGRILNLAGTLRKLRLDAVIILRPTLSTAIAAVLAGIPARVGTAYRYYSFLYNRPVREHRKFAGKHEADLNLDVARAVGGLAPGTFRPTIALDETAASFAGKALLELGLGSRRFVVVHPGSARSARNLPLEAYARLISGIKALADADVLLSTGPDEADIVRQLERLGEARPKILAGAPRLLDLAAIIREASLFISGSTGPMHIAAAVGTPTLSFFSPVRSCSPRRWRPLGEKQSIMMPPVPECPTCVGPKCEYYDCMARINVDAALDEARRLLTA